MSKKIVYFRQVESLYQHLIKGTVMYDSADSYGRYSLIEHSIEENLLHSKIYEKNIIEDGEKEYLKVQAIYKQEEIVKEAQRKLEQMRKENDK